MIPGWLLSGWASALEAAAAGVAACGIGADAGADAGAGSVTTGAGWLSETVAHPANAIALAQSRAMRSEGFGVTGISGTEQRFCITPDLADAVDSN